MKKKPVIKFSGLNSRNKVFLQDDYIERETTISYVVKKDRIFYDDILYITIHKRIYWSMLFFLFFLGILPFSIGFLFENTARFIIVGIGFFNMLLFLYLMFIKKLEIMNIVSLKKKMTILLKKRRKKRNLFIYKLLEKIEQANPLRVPEKNIEKTS
ncbi:MAG: hypothetical protein JW928_05540 [Candidatus Aureabacteria bacterium]|nr:hypothetical protein [Candidatus Auribacterota bacterium]